MAIKKCGDQVGLVAIYVAGIFRAGEISQNRFRDFRISFRRERPPQHGRGDGLIEQTKPAPHFIQRGMHFAVSPAAGKLPPDLLEPGPRPRHTPAGASHRSPAQSPGLPAPTLDLQPLTLSLPPLEPAECRKHRFDVVNLNLGLPDNRFPKGVTLKSSFMTVCPELNCTN